MASLHTHQATSTLFSIKQKSVIDQIQDDLGYLRLLDEALSIPPPRPIDQLTRTVLVPGRGGGGYDPAGRATGAAVEHHLKHRQEIAAKLKENKQFAEDLKLDFLKIVNTSRKLFLTDMGIIEKASDWLKPKDIYQLSELDIEDAIKSSLEALQDLSNEHVDQTHQAFIDNLRQALNLLLTREWTDAIILNTYKFSRTSEFLRFFARLCAIYLGASAKKLRPTYTADLMGQRNISDYCEHLIVILTLLEERFSGTRKRVEGIRLIKMV